jgi:16S rRNA (guanine527-N7)-methyltransferase
MIIYNEEFMLYLKRIGLYSAYVERIFELYHRELLKENSVLNLFSRKMTDDEIWLKHFLDSVIIFELVKHFKAKNILDFGSGAGLPSIPIKILCPDMKLTLLDSTNKKIESTKRIIKSLQLDNVSFLAKRIEDRELMSLYGSFDCIVSRGVKFTEVYADIVKKFIDRNGKIYLYKAKDIIDLQHFRNYVIYEKDFEHLGIRKIIEISYG